MNYFALAISLLLCISIEQNTFAQNGVSPGIKGAAEDKIIATVNVFYFSDESRKGNSTPSSGSTTLMRGNLQYTLARFHLGTGGYFELDRLGKDITRMEFGPRLELDLGYYYLFGNYGKTKLHITDRTVSERTGSSFGFGFGIRTTVDQTYAQRIFWDGGIYVRETTWDTEDGTTLDDKLWTREIYPIVGLGVILY